MRLLVATTNPGKVREIRELLQGLDVELLTLDDMPFVEAPDETGHTFEENARQKAMYYAGASGFLTVAEDSGLEIDALSREPGIHSARYGGDSATYPEKFALIYGRLDAVHGRGSTARFVCALALVQGHDVLFEARGTVEGTIADVPRGDGGFGYDPIFYYPPLGQTLAEIGHEKSSVSHRAEAFKQLRRFLERR